MANNGLPPGATLVSGSLPPAADVPTSDTPVSQSSTPGLPPGATLVSGTVPTAAPAAPTADQKFNQPFQPAPKVPVDPPQDHKEELVKSIGGDHGLAAYRAARKAVEGVEMMVKAPAESYEASKEIVKNLGTDMMSNLKANLTSTDPNNGQMYQTPITPIPGVGTAAKAFGAEEAAAAKVAPPVAASVTPTTRLTNPFMQKAKNVVKSVIQSPKDAKAIATQEPGISTVRSVTGGTGPLVDRATATTAADDMVSTRGVAKDAAYKQIDTTVGFDRKDALKQLKDAQYAIKQPGANVESIQKNIDELTPKLAEADKALAKAKIDPKIADNLNTSWEATKSFKNDLVQSTNTDGSLNVDALIKRAKSRFNPKYGDRLAQSFGNGDAAAGKPIAEEYVKGLQRAQAAGVKAASVQTLKRWVATLLAPGSLGIYEGAKWWLGN
jgi:hypothetical protein